MATPSSPYDMEILPIELKLEICRLVAAEDMTYVIPSGGRSLRKMITSTSPGRKPRGIDFMVVSNHPLFQSGQTRLLYLEKLQDKIIESDRIRVSVLKMGFTNALKVVRALEKNGKLQYFYGNGSRLLALRHLITAELIADAPMLSRWCKTIDKLEKNTPLELRHYIKMKQDASGVVFAALARFHKYQRPHLAYLDPVLGAPERPRMLQIFADEVHFGAATVGTTEERQVLDLHGSHVESDGGLIGQRGRDGKFYPIFPQPPPAFPLQFAGFSIGGLPFPPAAVTTAGVVLCNNVPGMRVFKSPPINAANAAAIQQAASVQQPPAPVHNIVNAPNGLNNHLQHNNAAMSGQAGGNGGDNGLGAGFPGPSPNNVQQHLGLHRYAPATAPATAPAPAAAPPGQGVHGVVAHQAPQAVIGQDPDSDDDEEDLHAGNGRDEPLHEGDSKDGAW